MVSITGDSGTRYAIVIIGNAVGLDWEDLASADSPRLRQRRETLESRSRWSKKVRDESGRYVMD